MSVCLFDPWNLHDAALVASHWVAERTSEALRALSEPVAVRHLSGAEVDEMSVALALGEPHAGFAWFGHGGANGVGPIGPGRPLPLSSVGERWFHAFACLSGLGLAASAADSVGAFVGYRTEVTVHWDALGLPEALARLLSALVVEATLQLARGTRSERDLRRAVREASDAVMDWLDRHADLLAEVDLGVVMGLHHTPVILRDHLVMVGRQVSPA